MMGMKCLQTEEFVLYYSAHSSDTKPPDSFVLQLTRLSTGLDLCVLLQKPSIFPPSQILEYILNLEYKAVCM